MEPPSITVVIPTYCREQVLVETVELVLRQASASAEVLVVDQTPQHEPATADALAGWERDGLVRVLRLDRPSIPHAMNVGLQSATGGIVLFLDDDIVPAEGLLAAHAKAYQELPGVSAVVGQVLQPGEQARPRTGRAPKRGFQTDLDFPFWSEQRAWVCNVMAGNLSVDRQRALEIGGFDENFEGVAYRFETEFCRRLIAGGGMVVFEPAASIRHLRASRGGTRAAGSHRHMTSVCPRHGYGLGDFYFALRSPLSPDTVTYMFRGTWQRVATRFHLTHPWYLPPRLAGEVRAFLRALVLARRGPRLVNSTAAAGTGNEVPLGEVELAPKAEACNSRVT